MEAQIDAAIQSRVNAIGLDAYVAKLKKDAEQALLLPQTTAGQIEHKIQMIVGTGSFVARVLTRSDLKPGDKTDLTGKLASLNDAVGKRSRETAPAAGGFKMPRKMSRKYCKKTPCKKMGFTQRSSCRPYKNCLTRRARRKA